MMKLLENKVVLISGGSRGIGAGITKLMAEQGAKVAFTYKSNSSKEISEQIIEELKQNNCQIKAYQSDASIYTEVENLINEVLNDFGTIDICINNAGISIDNLLMRLNYEQWEKTLANNLTSVFNFCKVVSKPMLKARNGSIINISSIVGIRGNAGQTAYAASKAGIIGFSKSLALELASRNIRCNVVAPGFIDTDMTAFLKKNPELEKAELNKIPLHRFGQAQDIANACLYFASNLSSYVTGQVLSICGGLNI